MTGEQLELFETGGIAPPVFSVLGLRIWTPDERVAYLEHTLTGLRIVVNVQQLLGFANECQRVANVMLRHAPRPEPK